MSPSCVIDLGGGPSPGTWTLEEADSAQPALQLSPSGGAPEAIALREVSGIARRDDGYTLVLSQGGRALTLAKLGPDGPALAERLLRLWPPLRAEALRLGGGGDREMFAGAVAWGSRGLPDGTAQLLVLDHVLLAATEGGDLEPLFLSDLRGTRFVPETYSVECLDWDGTSVVLSRLAFKTEAFTALLTRNRARLAAEASATLAATLPALPPAQRTQIAARWLPGQMLSLPELESAAPGVGGLLKTGWLADVPRAPEAQALRDGLPEGSVYLGYAISETPSGSEPATAPEPATAAEPTTAPDPAAAAEAAAVTGIAPHAEVSTDPETSAAPETAGGTAGPPLWLLADRGEAATPRWVLENLSEGDFATYRFSGGPELPRLIGHLLSAPQFSREALYLDLEELTGDRAGLAIPARDLRFLRELRARFAGRVIHGDTERWKADLDR